MQHQIDLLDELYQTAVSEFGKKDFSYEELIEKSMKKHGYSDEYIKNIKGSLYVDLLLDNRFVNIGDKWTLKQNLSFSEFEDKIKDMYQFCNNNLSEEVDDTDLVNSIEIEEEDDTEEVVYSDEDYDLESNSSDYRNITNMETELEDDEEDNDDRDVGLDK